MPDLYEQTMYNALLGGVALDGKSFCYTNPLVNTQRAKWHTCPCCVGNIPRTMLMKPTWSYVKSKQGVYVNIFAGSRIHVGGVAGTQLEMVQHTEYPWKGAVKITVNPEVAAMFTVYVRIPDRKTSKLYTETPALGGAKHFAVNGKKMYGPLVYNVETMDGHDIEQGLSDAPLTMEWRPDLLGGVMVMKGKWNDGSSMTAIPNFARMNRVPPPPEYPGSEGIDYAPGATTSSGATAPSRSAAIAAPPDPAIINSNAGEGVTAVSGKKR